LASAALGPFAGRSIDRWEGRPVLMASNVVFTLGLVMLGFARGTWSLFGAWLVMGVAMGSGLYEAAFATLVRLYGQDSRGAITGVTLFAGFASTVGWPLSAWFETHLGWRGACFAWAALHVAVALPLNGSLPRATRAIAGTESTEGVADDVVPDNPRRSAVLLATLFAITWFVSTAMAAHLPRLLMAGGATLAAAVAVGALVGPAQVAGRLLEFGFLRKMHPLLSARLAALMHPLGAATLLMFGAPAAVVFALCHGAGNGILTIAIGTLPLMIFGSRGYGQRQGMLMVPARIVQALAPWLFGVSLERWGTGALWLSSGLGIVAFGSLLLLHRPGAAVTSKVVQARTV
jgi:predicted MFS family arabinose efflux permease